VNPENAYYYSFGFGMVIQLILFPFLWVALVPAFVLSSMNAAAAWFVYPWLFVWLAKREWSPPPTWYQPPN